jgi:hypothetical protein
MNVNDLHQQDNIQVTSNQQTKQWKRCHGKRRDQRFRRKCRDQKMQPTKIEKLIKKRNRIHKKHQKNISGTHHTANANTTQQHNHTQPFITTTTNNNNKRKGDVSQQEHLSKTTDSTSISQPLSKKMKHTTNTMDINSNINENINENYRYVTFSLENNY